MMPLARAILALCLWALPAAATQVKLSVTTSFANSGLAEILLPQIRKDTGIEVQMLVVGTGQALKLGANGDVDAVLVHARDAEEAFVAQGHATHRTPVMYNDFVIIGPQADPAGVRETSEATAAFAKVASAGADFVSRGDDSGTHKKEQEIWDSAGISPQGDWYKSVGQGMGAALNTAAGMNAYILSDRASWLNFGNKGDLALVFEGDPDLFNQYSYLPVNPQKHPHVNAAAAAVLEAWLVSDRARDLIEGYRLDGQQLFVFNADPAK